MRLVGGTASLAVLLLLMSAAPAFAECAWVLWGGKATGDITDLIPIGAWSTRDECESKRTIAAQAATPNFILMPACLPDTVDPRGPKGSGR